MWPSFSKLFFLLFCISLSSSSVLIYTDPSLVFIIMGDVSCSGNFMELFVCYRYYFLLVKFEAWKIIPVHHVCQKCCLNNACKLVKEFSKDYIIPLFFVSSWWNSTWSLTLYLCFMKKFCALSLRKLQLIYEILKSYL